MLIRIILNMIALLAALEIGLDGHALGNGRLNHQLVLRGVLSRTTCENLIIFLKLLGKPETFRNLVCNIRVHLFNSMLKMGHVVVIIRMMTISISIVAKIAGRHHIEELVI